MAGRRPRVVMLLENNPFPADVRVRREAASLAAAGYDVEVVAPRGPGERRRETSAGVRIVRFTLPRTPATPAGFVVEYLVANLQLQLRAAVALLRGTDILHLHNPPDTLFPVAALARRLGRRVVYDQHDLAPELFRVKFGSSRMFGILSRMERATFNVAHLVLSPNESHRAVALGRGGVRPERVAVVRNGPPRSEVVEAPVGRAGALTDPHLVYVGSMESQDGVDALPAVMLELMERHGLQGTRLTLVGDGSRRGPVARSFAASAAGRGVHFTGTVDHAEVPHLVAQADICIDPAPSNELNDRSTMVKIAEYMAAGKPVVANPLRETRRTAADAALYADDGGTTAAFAAQIARLAADPVLRDELARRGVERAHGLTWERSEEELLNAYAELAA